MIRSEKFALRDVEIKSLSDERLTLIDPTVKGFYKNVLQFATANKNINAFVEAIYEVQKIELEPFWRPVMDPSEIDGEIVYMKGKPPAVGHSYKWWEDKLTNMNGVENKIWGIGNDYQYYVDKVDLINRLVAKGYDLSKAIEGVVLNSAKFGHYANSKKAKHHFEVTGSREVCDRYDLGNTCKIVRCTNWKDGVFWIVGGAYCHFGNDRPLIDFDYGSLVGIDGVCNISVAWPVLMSRAKFI